ncbi:hypothetical protein GCM10027421_16150 [Microbacterium shaanxiense]
MDRHERLRALNDEIAAFEKQAIGRAMVGQWTAQHDMKLRAFYDERRRLTRPAGSRLEQVVTNLHEFIALARRLRPALPPLRTPGSDADRAAVARIERLTDEIGGREADRLCLTAGGTWTADEDVALSGMYAEWSRLVEKWRDE